MSQSDARAALVGGATFWCTLASWQAVGSAVGLSCATPLLAPFAGAFAVSSGVLAIEAACVVGLGLPSPEPAERAGYVACALGLFQGTGGRFSSIFASDILHPGAFARESLPAGVDYATPSERRQVQALGSKYGCHSCGTRKTPTFIADHMPPIKLGRVHTSGFLGRFRKFPPQSFFPQCVDCSGIQAAVAREWKGRSSSSKLITHFLSARPYHGIGAVVAVLMYRLQRQENDELLEEQLELFNSPERHDSS